MPEQQTWPRDHLGLEENMEMPGVVHQLREQPHRTNGVGRPKLEITMEHGAGQFEDHYRLYWLITAWAVLGFNSLMMLAVLAHVALGWGGYNALLHALSTAIVVTSIGGMALVYRFVLFRQPFTHGVQYDNSDPYYDQQEVS